MSQDQLRGVGTWIRWIAYIKQGIIPLWWPTILTGAPTFDALVGDGSNPVGVLFMLLVPEIKRVGLMFWAHTIFAGATAYLLARRQFDLSRPVAAGLGSLWMLNTYSISLIYGGHTGKFYILSMLPLLVLGVLRFSGQRQVRWILLMSGTMAMVSGPRTCRWSISACGAPSLSGALGCGNSVATPRLWSAVSPASGSRCSWAWPWAPPSCTPRWDMSRRAPSAERKPAPR